MLEELIMTFTYPAVFTPHRDDKGYVLLMNESFLNIDALKENPDAMKSAVTVMFGNPQGSICRTVRGAVLLAARTLT